MGVDSRIENLTDEALLAELEALKATLKLAIDDPSYSAGDAKKILIATLLNKSVVTDNTNDFQAMTPKAFYDSVATESNLGVTRHASPAQINSGAEGNLTVIASELKRKLDELFSQSLLQQGYINFIGGFQLRWGKVLSTTDSAQNFTFAEPFTNECLNVVTTLETQQDISLFKDKFTFNRRDDVDGNVNMFYYAIGK